MSTPNKEQIAREAAEKFVRELHPRHADGKTLIGVSGMQDRFQDAIDKATEERVQNAYNEGWVAGRDALRAAQPQPSGLDKCKCGHSRQGHTWKGSGCAVTDCDCKAFEPSGSGRTTPTTLGAAAVCPFCGNKGLDSSYSSAGTELYCNGCHGSFNFPAFEHEVFEMWSEATANAARIWAAETF
jgi:hypothetical protein